MNIYRTEDKRKYMDLLLLADEQAEMIETYLDRGVMYVLEDSGIRGEIVTLDLGDRILEIKNLAVYPQDQKKGYGRALIGHVCTLAAARFDEVLVGTGDSSLTLPFYERCGFVRSHVVKNFFLEHYDHPIIEAGVRLADMIYLKRKL